MWAGVSQLVLDVDVDVSRYVGVLCQRAYGGATWMEAERVEEEVEEMVPSNLSVRCDDRIRLVSPTPGRLMSYLHLAAKSRRRATQTTRQKRISAGVLEAIGVLQGSQGHSQGGSERDSQGGHFGVRAIVYCAN